MFTTNFYWLRYSLIECYIIYVKCMPLHIFTMNHSDSSDSDIDFDEHAERIFKNRINFDLPGADCINIY